MDKKVDEFVDIIWNKWSLMLLYYYIYKGAYWRWINVLSIYWFWLKYVNWLLDHCPFICSWFSCSDSCYFHFPQISTTNPFSSPKIYSPSTSLLTETITFSPSTTMTNPPSSFSPSHFIQIIQKHFLRRPRLMSAFVRLKMKVSF